MDRLEDVYLIEKDKADDRRRATTLRECGGAVFLFGVWNAVRTALYFILFRDQYFGDIGPIPNVLFYIIVSGIVALALLPDIIIRFLCWRGCRRLARGEMCRTIIIVLLGLLCVAMVWVIYLDITTLITQEVELDLALMVSLLIDCTSCLVSLQTFGTAYYVRRHLDEAVQS